MDNCPHQAVLCGTEGTITRVQRELQADGVICQQLPYRRAYHTPLFAPVCTALEEFFLRLKFVPPKIAIYSCATATRFPEDPEEARRIALQQWTGPVRFRETIETMYADGIRTFVEAGPRGNLTAFVEDILCDKKHIAVAANVAKRSGLTQLNHLVGFLAAHGVPLTLRALYERRARELDMESILQKGCKAPLDKSMPLSLALPMLELPESRSSKMQAPRFEPAVEQTVATPISKLLEPEFQSLPKPETPSLSLNGFGNGGSGESPDASAVMHEYLSTMDHFLEAQQDVLRCYLEEAGIETDHSEPAITASALAASRPFIGRVLKIVAGREAVASREFDIEKDVFLRHHALGPRLSDADPELLPLPLVPLAVSVEMMAEAAALVLPDLRVREIKNVRALHWIALKASRLSLEIEARMSTGRNEVNVKIREAAGGVGGEKAVVFAEGTVVFGELGQGPSAEHFHMHSERDASWKPSELYAEGQRHGMFHGPAFQGIASLDRVGSNGAEATIRAPSTPRVFGPAHSAGLLTRPLLVDAAGQVLGFWAAEHLDRASIVFPARFESLYLYAAAPGPQSESGVCRAEVTDVNETTIRANLDVVDAAGHLLLRVVGWEAKRFDLPERFYAFRLAPAKAFASIPWPKPLQHLPNPERFECCRVEFPPGFMEAEGGIWRECLAHLMLSARERETWQTLGKSEGRRTDWLLGRLAAKDAIRLLMKKRHGAALYPADIDLSADEDGRPLARLMSATHIQAVPVVSIAHSDGTAVAIATEEHNCLGLGIDVERESKKDIGFEVAGFTEEERSLLALCEPGLKNQWLIRLWCAKEAVSKALGKGLLDGPGTLLAKQLDLQTGAVKLSLSGALKDRFPEISGNLLTACTEQQSSFIFATATRERN
jgi:phosphopantetheinyl transferase